MSSFLKSPDANFNSLIKVFKDSIIAGGGEFVFITSMYMSNLLISRFLGAAGMGIYAQAMAIILSVALVARLGLDVGLLRFLPAYLANQKLEYVKGFLHFGLRLLLLVSLTLTGLIFIFADGVSRYFFHEPQMSLVLQGLTLTLPFVVLRLIGLNILQAFNHTLYRILIGKLTIPLLGLGSLALFLTWGWQWYGVLTSALMTAVVGGLLVYYACYKLQDAIPGIEKVERKLAVREWLHFGYPLFTSELLAIASSRVIILMLGYFQDSTTVGIYEVTLKITLIIQMPLDISILILAPMMSTLYSKGEMTRLQVLFKETTQWIFTVSIFLFLIITLLAQSVLTIFGSEFTSGRLALYVLAFGYLINVSTGIVGWMLIISNHLRVHLFNSVLSILLTCLLGFLLIPTQGILGAAITICLVEILVNLLRLVEVMYFLRIHPYRWSYLKPLGAGLLTLGGIYFLQKEFLSVFEPSLFWVILVVMMSLIFACYVLLLLLFYSSQLYKLRSYPI